MYGICTRKTRTSVEQAFILLNADFYEVTAFMQLL
jgi:hypothetical protein